HQWRFSQTFYLAVTYVCLEINQAGYSLLLQH
uniref:Uncharacterized protein n=1 Tax=Aegilops tauschii subsp. strangulata TaxID=200361 RepID=A0A453IV51_AEGTS